MAKRSQRAASQVDAAAEDIGAIAPTGGAADQHLVVFRIADHRFGFRLDDVGEIMHEPGPRLAAHDDSCEQNGFMFFVALNDRRASWTPDGTVRSWTPEGVGLSAGPDGWAGISTSGLWWWKDESLAREVDRLYRDWTARGRPTIRDYRVTFLPVKDERNTPPGGWQIERRFYREIVTAD